MSARSFRPLWTLEELGLPYKLKMLSFPPRMTTREFLDENPLGTVPLMIDSTTRMTESAAISQYLCAIHAPTLLQLEPGEPDYGSYLNYLHFGEATLTFPQTLVLRYSRFEPDARKQPAVVADYTKWFLGRLRTLEPQLSNNDYLCAGRFTAADISVGYALMLAEQLGLQEQFPPAIKAYWKLLQQRPAFMRALQAQEKAAIDQGVPTTLAMNVLPPGG